jgi:hypothetical protein
VNFVIYGNRGCEAANKCTFEKGYTIMPVTYRFDLNVIVIELIGQYSIDDLRTAVLKSFNDPQCPKNPALIIDLSKSQSIYQRSSKSVNAMVTFITSFGKKFNNRLAIVVPDDVTYGFMRMSSVPADSYGIDVKIFRTYGEARKWLP